MTAKNQIYFASDFHLGAPNYQSSREREKTIVAWLTEISKDASEIFLMGDIFDFWFEYATVIPKGFIRLQGKLAELADRGIKIYFFKGNHDMWVFDYFKKEFGLIVIDNELTIERNGKKFFLHHGDGLGPGDNKYKFLKKIFRSKTSQWLFARLHPNLGIGIANYWSSKSRISNLKKDEFIDEEHEWLAIYSKAILQKDHFDYFVYGHRHLPLTINLGKNSTYINLGEWVHYKTYAVFDGETLQLKEWKTN